MEIQTVSTATKLCETKKNNRSKKYKIQKKSRMDKLHLLFLEAC